MPMPDNMEQRHEVALASWMNAVVDPWHEATRGLDATASKYAHASLLRSRLSGFYKTSAIEIALKKIEEKLKRDPGKVARSMVRWWIRDPPITHVV